MKQHLHSTPFLALLGAAVLTIGAAEAQTRQPALRRFVAESATRIADPKLEGGAPEFALRLGAGVPPTVATVTVVQNGVVLDEVWTGTLSDGATQVIAWDGRDDQGDRCPTGRYDVRVTAVGVTPLELPLDLVRLGVTEIEAQDSPAGDDEFPMVYFRKGSTYAYYATPAIHEYANLASPGEISDLDQDDGEPRPVVAVHTATDSPVLDGANYETDTHNYPLAYAMGASPRLELTFGAEGTTSDGAPMPAGFPVAGFDLRAVVSDETGAVSTGPLVAGGTALIDLGALPAEVGRTERELALRWQAAPAGTDDWADVPGEQRIPLRFYTLLGPPVWESGASGTRYAGPWVEVVEFVSTWKDTLGLPTHDVTALTEVFVQGFFGQNGGLPAAIEGVIYDCYPMGGDGGATHYFSWGSWRMDLSRLLNAHASGVFVNCTDNMGAETTMLGMLGVPNMRPVQLGEMNLQAIWGIGTPAYTTNLWGSGHGFSYHHIVTDDDAVTVSDTCMQLDEDGMPESTPGIPGWNHHRVWKGANGYRQLSCTNAPGKQLQALPGIQ